MNLREILIFLSVIVLAIIAWVLIQKVFFPSQGTVSAGNVLIPFPDSPTENQVFVHNGITYRWMTPGNGFRWVIVQ